MPVEFDRGSPGKFDSRTLNRKTLSRWTGRITPGLKWYHPAETIGNPMENQGFQLPEDSLGKAYRGVPLCTDLGFSLNY